MRMVDVLRAQTVDGFRASSDPYLGLLDTYLTEIQRSCREVCRTDKKELTRDLVRWDRATTVTEQKLNFCYDLQKVSEIVIVGTEQ